MKVKLLTAMKKIKKEQWIIGAITGILLLVISMPVEKDAKEETVIVEKEDTTVSTNSYTELYERQLEEALSLVEGVGEVKVAVTVESSGNKIVEKDVPANTETSTQKDAEGSESNSEYSSLQESTVYEETENGEQIPYVISETYPEIRGVLVVAQGGENPVIVQEIQEAVMALFHIDAHKIKVLKMK